MAAALYEEREEARKNNLLGGGGGGGSSSGSSSSSSSSSSSILGGGSFVGETGVVDGLPLSQHKLEKRLRQHPSFSVLGQCELGGQRPQHRPSAAEERIADFVGLWRSLCGLAAASGDDAATAGDSDGDPATAGADAARHPRGAQQIALLVGALAEVDALAHLANFLVFLVDGGASGGEGLDTCVTGLRVASMPPVFDLRFLPTNDTPSHQHHSVSSSSSSSSSLAAATEGKSGGSREGKLAAPPSSPSSSPTSRPLLPQGGGGGSSAGAPFAAASTSSELALLSGGSSSSEVLPVPPLPNVLGGIRTACVIVETMRLIVSSAQQQRQPQQTDKQEDERQDERKAVGGAGPDGDDEQPQRLPQEADAPSVFLELPLASATLIHGRPVIEAARRKRGGGGGGGVWCVRAVHPGSRRARRTRRRVSTKGNQIG